MKQKRKQKQTPKKLPDFSVEDIINAPKPKEANKGSACPHCGSVSYISKGVVKVFRGQRMIVCHCHGCGRDFYKEE